MRLDALMRELRNAIILQGLGNRELRRFAKACELRDYEAGEYLVEQDMLGSDLHILIEGCVDITVSGAEGGEVKVSEVRKGDVLGEASIFMDLPRTANAVASGACLVAAVSRDKLFAYCERNPKAGLKIFGFVIYSLLRRLGATSRELAHERESVVTAADLERLGACFPKSLEDILKAR
jgi:cAMP-binding proteins - catabolite gene activator and regulatory subunit of cAMP-dependent protein kinases